MSDIAALVTQPTTRKEETMKGRTRRRAWTPAGLLVVPLLLTAPGARARSVDLDVQVSQPALLAGAPRTTHVWIGLTGKAGSPDRRAPLNVAIVLDRSGSMTGRKIEEARRAAIMAIGRLRDDDIVSVVAYQSTVDVLVPATKLHDRRQVLSAIRSVEAGGSTALFGGVSKGAQELGKFLDRNRVNTLILLSDGLANVGPRSPGELAALGASLARQGMAVTTIGLGLDYNEDLMTRLALASDGNHFFVEDASDLEYAFATEFGDALSAVAQGVDLHIRCPEGVRPVRVLGREAQISGRDVHASMNQLFRDQTRYLVLEVEVPSGRPGASRPVADVEVRYHDLLRGAGATVRDGAAVTFTDSPAIVEARTNGEVMVEVVRQIGTERNELATALRDAGRIEEARRAYLANSAYLEENARKLDDASLQLDADANEGASRNLEPGQWNRERKKQLELQFKGKQQRAPLVPPKKEPERDQRRD
jgi:Ca-activated chloride channel family protein